MRSGQSSSNRVRGHKFHSKGSSAFVWKFLDTLIENHFTILTGLPRYYYKHKVFEIVPNKRLVYKFGSRAYNWRNQELEKPGAPRVPCPAQVSILLAAAVLSFPGDTCAQGRRRTTWRCGECLRMFQSGREHEVRKLSLKLTSLQFFYCVY